MYTLHRICLQIIRLSWDVVTGRFSISLLDKGQEEQVVCLIVSNTPAYNNTVQKSAWPYAALTILWFKKWCILMPIIYKYAENITLQTVIQ